MPICFTAHVGLTLMYKKTPEKIHTELKNNFFVYILNNANRAGKLAGNSKKNHQKDRHYFLSRKKPIETEKESCLV